MWRYHFVGRALTWWCFATFVAACFASPAHAQIVLPPTVPIAPPWNAQQVFDPQVFPQWWDMNWQAERLPEDTPVKTRLQPGYEPIGMRFGSWMFDPSITAGGLYDSNVFATPSNQQGDIASLIQPAFRLHSLWERNQVDLLGVVQNYSYLNNPGLDQTNAILTGHGRWDVRDDAQILTSGFAGLQHDGVGSLTSPTGAVKPTPYSLFWGDVTYRQEFGRWIASAGTRFESYDYGSTVSQNGTIIDQSARDGQIYIAHGRVDYLISPKVGLFTAFDANQRDLRGTPLQPLSSDGYRALAGIDMEFTRLISGEIAAGFARQRFDSGLIGTIQGPTFRAMLVWSPTRTIDVWFKAEQIITEASQTDASGIRADAAIVGVDYELRRNVILSVTGTYENDKFYGQPRTDNVMATYNELRYLLNRYVTLALRYSFTWRDSNIPIDSYSKHQVGFNVTAQF
jgi:hypothetical protein